MQDGRWCLEAIVNFELIMIRSGAIGGRVVMAAGQTKKQEQSIVYINPLRDGL